MAFPAAWAEAEAESADTIDAEARRRAVEGVKRTATVAGQAGTYLGDSDRLLMCLPQAPAHEKCRQPYEHRLPQHGQVHIYLPERRLLAADAR